MQSENTPKIDYAPMPNVAELEPHYPFACATCGHEQNARPSIFMEMGINTGSGQCLNCAAYLHLEIAVDNTRMISRRYSEWLLTFNVVSTEAGEE